MKKKGVSNILLLLRYWNRKSPYDRIVVASLYLNHGYWPHHCKTIYVVAVHSTGSCSQKIYEGEPKTSCMKIVIGWLWNLWHRNIIVSTKRNECTGTISHKQNVFPIWFIQARSQFPSPLLRITGASFFASALPCSPLANSCFLPVHPYALTCRPGHFYCTLVLPCPYLDHSGFTYVNFWPPGQRWGGPLLDRSKLVWIFALLVCACSSLFFSVLGIPNIYEALSLGPNNSTKFFGSCLFSNKSWAWHLPCNTVSFVSKIRASSNTPLGPRLWKRRSTYDGMVVARSHLNHGLGPHRRNTVYVVAVHPAGCCSQDI